MKKILIILFATFVAFSAFSQNNPTDYIINQTFGQKSEVYFSFQVQTPEIMSQLTKIISIDNVKGNEVIAVANKKEFELFLEFGIAYTLLPAPWELLPPEAYVMSDDLRNKSTHAWDVYPTYDAYIDMMNQFAIDYPTLCRIETIGYSEQNRLIISAVISDNVHVDEYEPEFLYTSTMHGDEVVGYVILLRLIDYLLTNYGTIPRVTNLVNNMEIHINPLANPDGTYITGNNSVSGAIRNNANNYDLNRNFPCPDGNMYPNGTRQPETILFMEYAQNNDFVVSANFHGGAELMNYPWDYTTTNHPDKQWWIYVSKEYADTAQANSPSGYFDDYCTGPPNCAVGFDYPGVTEGANWYAVDGSRQDYMQYYAYCREVTNEISGTKMPAASTLPNYWNYNWRALLNYIEQGMYGFKGIVTDGCTGDSIKAKIELVGHDGQNSHVYSSLPIGNYHRPVKAGTYTIRASQPGYISQEYTNVAITDKNTVVRNFQLMPEPPVISFSADREFSCDGVIHFQNLSLAPQDVVYTWHFGDGSTSNDANPVHTYAANGVFTVKLVGTSCAGNDSLIRTAYIEVAMPSPPVSSDESRCGQGTLTFNATATGEIYWWDATGSNVLETGFSFTTPLLTQTTDYLVSTFEGTPPCFGGKTDTVGPGGAFFNAAATHGLIFDAQKPMIIRSAEFYASGAGNREIRILDASNNEITSVTVNIPDGHSTVQLDLEVPVGTGLKLVGPASAQNLYRNNVSPASIGYPFNLCGIMTITGSTAGNSYYYYFYNIEVEEQTTFFGAQTNQTATGGYYTQTTPHGLYFDCTEEVTLKSVKVYSNTAGNRTISLRDGSDNLIENTVVNIPSGESRIDLNFNIPVGTNLRLMGPAAPSLWRDGSPTAPDLPYPFAVGDVISITGNSANNVKYYYYFYDWEVEKAGGCESPKLPVTAYIYENPVPSFTWIENSFVVTFTNQSTGGGSYLWDFGDSNTSTDENPVHTYASGGSYTVTLTLTNDCGTDVFSDVIAVSTVSVYTPDLHVEVFPNPVEDKLTIRTKSVILDMSLYNLQGIKIIDNKVNDTGVTLSLENIASGTYILKLITESGTYSCLVVKK